MTEHSILTLVEFITPVSKSIFKMLKDIVAHTILIVFAALVTVNAKPGSSLFSWHPFCMVLAVLLWTEGILSFRTPRPSLRVNVHWALNGTATILAFFGFLASYKQKTNDKEPHFATYHGIAGAIAMVLLLSQTFGGNLVVYRKKVSCIPAGLLKWGHRIAGVVTISAVYISLFFKLSWFISLLLLYPYLYSLNKFLNVHFKVKSKDKVKKGK